jgi:hypothetical protein
MANEVLDFIKDPDWHDPERMKAVFEWMNTPEIENSGEGRRQLGYLDGYEGEPPASRNEDYLKGWNQGAIMRHVQY